jgi:prepilin-type processing-associated H-X9-DG protein
MFGRYPSKIRFEDATDGTTNTIMAGETIPSHSIHNVAFGGNFPMCGTTIPINLMEAPKSTTHADSPHWRVQGYKSYHSGGANFLMGDASVHFLSENIDYRLYNYLGDKADDQPIKLPD